MSVVVMGRSLRHTDADMVDRKLIPEPHNLWMPVLRDHRRTWDEASITPDLLRGKLWMETVQAGLDIDLIELIHRTWIGTPAPIQLVVRLPVGIDRRSQTRSRL
jgi:hypothetical protein